MIYRVVKVTEMLCGD